ncbi:hypothetical protein H6P81_003652 [Aristolochia fimbriata]|uniref:General transcription and DNA repair factor IIH subunit TFB5 n=1 Tax=Aristolochia fimbriata TaxID=158543 RepID=A0AAV7FF49_ARIFI|nr:hypothetical protein H6P81_003652 [Aristolochia fimbriata]
MHIVEAVLEDTTGLNYIFYRMDERLLLDLLKTLKSLIVCIRSQRSYLCMGQAAKPLCGIFVEEEHPLASNVTKRFPGSRSSAAACWLPLVKACGAYIMVNATKGLFISCDVPMAQFIVSYNASLPLPRVYVRHSFTIYESSYVSPRLIDIALKLNY